MRRVLAAAFALCIATSAFAQSGLLPANQVWAGPPSGGQGFARARALVGADVPAPGASSLGGVQSLTCSSSNWFRTLSTGGVFGCSQPAITDISGLGAGVATALGIAPGSAGGPVLFNGAGGTPSSLVATNATGTAAGLTAGHVTTNANLTGDVTSVGNATAVALIGGVAPGPGATAAAGQLPGTATNSSATAGNVGEFKTATASAAAVSLTANVAANCVTLSLTAGDWAVSGEAAYVGAASTTAIYSRSSVSAVTATEGGVSNTFFGNSVAYFSTVNGAGFTSAVPAVRVSLASTANVFLVGFFNFGTSTATCGGVLNAWRAR